MGSTEEVTAYMELNARTMIESLIETAPIISSKREVEVRVYRDFLALFSKKRFVLWQKLSGNQKKQADEMISQFLGVTRKAIPMTVENP